MDDPTDTPQRLTALGDFIAAAEAEVVRLLQVEREAEAALAHLRLTPPKLLWPEGVTLAVDGPGRGPEPVAEPAPELLPPKRRAESRLRREAPTETPAPSPAAARPEANRTSPAAPIAAAGAATKPAEPPASVEPGPSAPEPELAARPSAAAPAGTLVPVSGLRRPKNLVEALS